MDSVGDTIQGKSSWGGYRPGAGRKPGPMSQYKIDRREAKKIFQARVARMSDRLFNSQYNLAKGEQYLMHKYTVGSGAKARTVIDVVDDPETIKQYLNDELNSANDEDYYYLSTKPANGQAIDSLLDRSFGKAEQKFELEHSGEIGDGSVDPKKRLEFEAWLKTQQDK